MFGYKRVFGYENVRLDGHVERRIVESEAAVVRRIFELSVAGYGMKAIAKRLNADGAPSPRSQRGRSRSWVASSVREALHRDLYRGVIAGRRAEARRFLASALLEDPANARPIVTSLLVGRVTIAPTTNPREWKMCGEGTLAGLFKELSRWVGVPGQN